MSIAIHHGANGSYKTFTLIQRFAIDALKKGRVVVTNVRGFTNIERIEAAFPNIEFPDTACIIHLNTIKIPENKLLLGCWWRWIPFGALVIIDEAQSIYPKRLGNKMRDQFTKVALPEIEIQQTYNDEPRPDNFEIAFEMHRHFNWDIFLSTPNINKIHPEIRATTELAYRHKSLETVASFMKGYWMEFQHDPENSGKSPFHYQGSPSRYKFDPRAGACYDSTTTGEHKKSMAGKPFYKQTKILVAGLVVIIGAYRAITNGKEVINERTEIFNKSSEVHPLPDSSKDIIIPSPSRNHPDNQPDNPLVNFRAPSASEWERAAAAENLQLTKLSITGYEIKDLDNLPLICNPYKSNIKCKLDRVRSRRFVNTYCIKDECYLFIYPKEKPKKLEPLDPLKITNPLEIAKNDN